MNDNIIFLVLKIIYDGDNVTGLLKRNYTYGQLAECLSYLINNGLIIRKHEIFMVSELGNLKLVELEARNHKTWFLEPFAEMRDEKIDLDDIYIP